MRSTSRARLSLPRNRDCFGRPQLAALVVLFAATCCSDLAKADAAYSRFGFCAPPVSPACIDKLKGVTGELAACEQETERYVASVFAYRACLSAEMERAVRETNEAIQKVRCERKPSLCWRAPIDAERDPTPAKPKLSDKGNGKPNSKP
jgi:hypothetical protein